MFNDIFDKCANLFCVFLDTCLVSGGKELTMGKVLDVEGEFLDSF